MSNLLLTVEEVREAIYADYDFDENKLLSYSKLASSYVKTKTGYDFGKEETINELAKEAARMYVKTSHFGDSKYSKDYNYSLGLESLIFDLQIIANQKIAVEEAAEVVEG